MSKNIQFNEDDYTSDLENINGSTVDRDVIDFLRKQGQHIKSLTEATKEVYTQQEKLGKTQNEINTEFENIKNDKFRLVEILGIFVAIFTFVSIEIQILRVATDFLRLAGLTVIIFSALSFFLFTLHLISEVWIRQSKPYKLDKKTTIFYGIVFLILIFGILLVGLGDYKNPSVITENEDFLRLKEQVNNLENESTELKSDIQELEEKLDIKKVEVEITNNSKED